MEINFSQIGRNLAVSSLAVKDTADKNPTEAVSVQFAVPGADQSKSGQATEAKENLNATALSSRQQSTQDFLQSAEKEDSTEKALSSQEISAAVEGLSDFAKATNRQLNFSIDEATDKQVVKVTDAESGEVIRQIPSEEILRLSERLRELQSDLGATVGILFNKQV